MYTFAMMISFEQAIYFTCHKLAKASDDQLRQNNISIKGRDRLLQKPIEISSKDTKSAAAFALARSFLTNKSIFNCDPNLDDDNNLECAAHEVAHATQLWGKGTNFKTTIASYGIMFATVPMPLLVSSNTAGMCLVGGFLTGLSALRWGSRQDELQAHRFGFTFHPAAYQPITPDEMTVLSKVKSLPDKFKDHCKGYPTPEERALIFTQAKRDCHKGNALFSLEQPPQVAFKNWQDAGSPRF